LADKAKQSGTSYQSRGDAEKSFQEKHAIQYASKYAAEPPKRPEHVPQTTTVGGNAYNITYDRGRGGYGYYAGSEWYFYDAMRDAAMLSILMDRNNYYYPRPAYAPVEYVGVDGSGAVVLLVVLGGVILVIIVAVAVKRM
jgi:hypothetical protein